MARRDILETVDPNAASRGTFLFKEMLSPRRRKKRLDVMDFARYQRGESPDILARRAMLRPDYLQTAPTYGEALKGFTTPAQYREQFTAPMAGQAADIAEQAVQTGRPAREQGKYELEQARGYGGIKAAEAETARQRMLTESQTATEAQAREFAGQRQPTELRTAEAAAGTAETEAEQAAYELQRQKEMQQAGFTDQEAFQIEQLQGQAEVLRGIDTPEAQAQLGGILMQMQQLYNMARERNQQAPIAGQTIPIGEEQGQRAGLIGGGTLVSPVEQRLQRQQEASMIVMSLADILNVASTIGEGRGMWTADLDIDVANAQDVFNQISEVLASIPDEDTKEAVKIALSRDERLQRLLGYTRGLKWLNAAMSGIPEPPETKVQKIAFQLKELLKGNAVGAGNL